MSTKTVKSNPTAIWAVNSDGTITLAAGEGLRALGAEPTEMLGQSIFQVFPDAESLIRKCLEGSEFSTEADVAGCIWETSFLPMRDKNGEVTGAIGFSTDITMSQRTELELRKTQALLESAIKNSPSGILIADAPDVKVRMANASAMRIHGKPDASASEIFIEDHEDKWTSCYPDGTKLENEA